MFAKSCTIPVPAALLALAAAALLVPVTAAASDLGTSVGTASWPGWESQALSAVSHVRGDGQVTVGEVGPVVYSSVATPSGPLSVAQRMETAEDGGGTVDLHLTVLGTSQVLVSEIGATGAGNGATLVLRPGSSTIAHSYPAPDPATAPSTTGATRRGTRHGVSTDAVVHHLGPASHGHRAAFAVTGGCRPTPQAPFVAQTTFGPLVDGIGQIRCSSTATLGLIVSLYRGVFTHVGTTEGGTDGPLLVYTVSSYFFCTHISGTHEFRSSQIWSVNGTDEGGATSAEAWLHCT